LSRIILEPANPFDFEDGSLEELGEELREETGKPTEVVRRPEHGYGVIFNEVLHVWLVWNTYGGPAATAAVAAITGWAKRRWKQDREKNPERPRTRSVIFWGADGKPLKSITVEMGEGDEPIVVEQQLDDIPQRPRPRN